MIDVRKNLRWNKIRSGSPTLPNVRQPPAVVYEEGVVVNGVLIAEPVGMNEYVFVGGGWYYWYPMLAIWVHTHRAAGWRPAEGVHVYRNWTDHLMYRRRR